MMKLSAYTVALAIAASTTTQTNAFITPNTNAAISSRPQQCSSPIYMSANETGSAFVADVDTGTAPDEDKTFDAVEKMGRGAAKQKRGKRKGGGDASSTASLNKAAAKLEPEETFYEGPPAITETITPTISILTVVGIVPAAAAWARQA